MNTLRWTLRLLLALGVVLLIQAALPSEAEAQCSSCTDCQNCQQAPWGGEGCDFKGPQICPCRETGGNCNPTGSLNVDPVDQRLADTEAGKLLVVRLESSIFGTWSCSEGDSNRSIPGS